MSGTTKTRIHLSVFSKSLKSKHIILCNQKISRFRYGENDTQILLDAMIEFRRLLIQITGGYDVMLKACTVAGIAMRIYRHLFLPKGQLAIVPEYVFFIFRQN